MKSPQAGRGDSLCFRLQVSNNGSKTDKMEVPLRIDGKTVGKKNITPKPGETQEVSFKIEGQDYGNHKVSIGDSSTSFSVLKSSDLSEPKVSFEFDGEAGELSLEHKGGRSIRNAIDELGNWENLELVKNGSKSLSQPKITGDGDRHFEPGEKITAKSAFGGDKVKAYYSRSGKALGETDVPSDVDFPHFHTKT